MLIFAGDKSVSCTKKKKKKNPPENLQQLICCKASARTVFSPVQ